MNEHQHKDGETCCQHSTTATQSLNELDFERGIWTAALYNDLERLRKMIDQGETNRCDTSGYTALHYAARQGHYDVCKLLVDNKAEVNARTNGGATPLYRAAMMGRDHIVELLINAGASATIQDDDGNTPLHRAAVNGHLNVAKILLKSVDHLHTYANNKGRRPWDVTPDNDKEMKFILKYD